MADEPSVNDMDMSFEENDRSKEGEPDSDELSGQSFSDGDNGDNAGCRDGSDGDERKRKKRRRGRHKGGKHHRKYRPYTQLSWSERRVVDAREAQRATQKREDAFLSGHPVAPYNTTQFLIDDHIQSEASPDLNQEPQEPAAPAVVPLPASEPERKKSNDQKDPTAADCLQKDDDALNYEVETPDPQFVEDEEEEQQFLAKEFKTQYEILRRERIQSMSREELVKEHIELERKFEYLEKQVLKSTVKDINAGGKDADKDKESSDANSLGSSNEEFIDLSSTIKQDAAVRA